MLDELVTDGQKKISQVFEPGHDRDVDLRDIVTNEFSTKGSVSKAAYYEWRDNFLAHLTHEEQILMPLTADVRPSNPDRRYKAMFSRVTNPSFNLFQEDFFL